jgi:hypothetical protein
MSELLESEDYLFLRLYSIDLDTARHTLGLIEASSEQSAQFCLLRDLIVTYCRPFSGNRGKLKKKHRLEALLPAVVPPEYDELHKTLTRYRDKLFAHTDMDAYAPRATKWAQEVGASFPMSFWGLDYTLLLARLPDIRALLSAVETAINTEVERLEASV